MPGELNIADTKELASVLELLEKGVSSTKEPGDLLRFLGSQQRRLLEDTHGYFYFFKKTIHKRNKFGKVCTCGVWRCKQYRNFYCTCAVYTFGDTIVGSTGPHNHQPIEKKKAKQFLKYRDPVPSFISTELANKIRQHNQGPKVESARRSIQRAHQQITSSRPRKRRKKEGSGDEMKSTAMEGVVGTSYPSSAGTTQSSCTVVTSTTTVPTPSTLTTPPPTPVTTLPALVTPPDPATPTTLAGMLTSTAPVETPPTSLGVTQEGPSKDTLNEILDILQEISKHSAPSYQLLCRQLISDVLGTQKTVSSTATSVPSSAVNTPSPISTSRGTISTIKIPLHDIPVFTSQSINNSDVSIVSGNFQTSDILPTVRAPPKSFVKSTPAPPPNVTINTCYAVPAPAINPQLRPIIKIPSLEQERCDPPPPQAISDKDTSVPELPPRSEYNILSDMSSLESLLDVLMENSPLRDLDQQSPVTRCTCRTMLQCALHDSCKKKKPGPKPRKVTDDSKKPARKKYCYRGSKKPYKFIPEVFKDCQLPSNDDTVIGHVPAGPPTTKRGRGGRKSRLTRPINIPSPTPPTLPMPLPSLPKKRKSPNLQHISPGPAPPKSSNTINLVPVTSVSGNNLEGSKLLKAVPIGNGLYRLEEANETEMQSDALSKPVYQADLGPGGAAVLPNSFGGCIQQSPAPFSTSGSHKTGLVEHHPTISASNTLSYSSNPYDNTNPPPSSPPPEIGTILQSVLNNISTTEQESVPLMIPTNTATPAPVSTAVESSPTPAVSSSANTAPNSLILNQLIEKLMSIETPDDKILEALNLTIPQPGIPQH